MLTEPHIIESLSRAYIRAIAGKAGLNLSIREYDYGVDGNFDEVIIRKNRRVESGFSLSFQLKASTQWQRDDTNVTYDLEAKTYNDLVIRRSFKMAVPCILLLLTLPPDSSEWLIYNEEEMRLRGCCYWEYLSGTPTENRQSVRIKIPRQQRLTPESLRAFNRSVQNRRAVMTQQMQQDELQIHYPQIADIVSYLYQNGWQQLAHPSQRILVFQNGTDDVGNPIQLVLPSNNSFEDSPRLIAKAINLLAAVQEKPSQEIINLVRQAGTSSVKG